MADKYPFVQEAGGSTIWPSLWMRTPHVGLGCRVLAAMVRIRNRAVCDGPYFEGKKAMPQRYVSDELTHFVGRAQPDDEARYRLLLRIIQEGFLTSDPNAPLARARIEGAVAYSYTPHEPFSSDTYDVQCVCFCDIPVPDLPFHMLKYGPFGLAFGKSFLLMKGACPVFYWAGDALMEERPRQEYLDQMVANFHWLIDFARAHRPYPTGGDWNEVEGRLHLLRDFINRNVLCFIKLFRAALPDEDPYNYYMEREWRVHGSLAFAIRDISRVIIPPAFAERFRRDVPEYCGQIEFARTPVAPS